MSALGNSPQRAELLPAPSPSRWRKFQALSSQQKRTLFFACLLIPVFRMRSSLRTYPASHVYGTAFERASKSPDALSPALTRVNVCELAAAVNIAAAHGPVRGNCVARSATLLWLLSRYGIAGTLRVGVRLADGNLAAHAWVECDGEPVNDRADIGLEYLPFTEAIPITAFTR